ncbi:MAG: AI-2E family transporter [Anaeromyxobacteraceae bacterium]
MNPRFQALVHGAFLAVIAGWVLHVGREVLVPLAFGVLVAYVIFGLSQLLLRIPVLGPRLPVQVRNAVSVLVISSGLVGIVFLLLGSADGITAYAPQYQRSLLAGIQRVAVLLRIEAEPTWTTLRNDLLAQVNLQRLLGSVVASVSSMVATVAVVILYAAFLMMEQGVFAEKLAQASGDARNAARIRELTDAINRRVGAYLSVKTAINVLLGLVSYAILALLGVKFAGLLAVIIGMLNYIPYAGSVFGVVIPVAVALGQFGDPGAVLGVLAALTAAQVVIGNFLDPYLMGSSLNLSPFAILVSLAVWTQLWGIAGAVLAVPITSVMVIVFSEFAGTRPIAILLSKNGRP